MFWPLLLGCLEGERPTGALDAADDPLLLEIDGDGTCTTIPLDWLDPTTCAQWISPLLSPVSGIRLHANSAGQLWVVDSGAFDLGVMTSLDGLHEPVEQVKDVWGCGTEVWAAGGDTVSRFDGLRTEWTLDTAGAALLSGSGCGDDAWVGSQDGVWHYDGQSWQKWPLEIDVSSIQRVGPWVVGAARYGRIAARRDGESQWRIHGIEDLSFTDVFLRESGQGFVLFNGADYFDLNEEFIPFSPMPGSFLPNRVHLRASGEAVFVSEYPRALLTMEADSVWPDSADCTAYPIPADVPDTPSGTHLSLADVSASSTGIWGLGRMWNTEAGLAQPVLVYVPDSREGICIVR